jgi:hypothetical protein
VLGAPEETVRLAVTGLSRAGKTVFSTALSANLLALPADPRRMARLPAAADGRIRAVREAAADGAPTFPLAEALAALSAEAIWPRPTTRLSKLALELEIEPAATAWLERELDHTRRVVRLELYDYPGEWLLDVPMLDRSFWEWSAAELARSETSARAPLAAAWRAALAAGDGDPAPLVAAWRAYLEACRAAGLVALTPGRHLNPGDWEGAPHMQFCPLPPPAGSPRPGGLAAGMAAAFDAYCARTRSEFLEPHLARFDAQIVLADLFGAIAAGAASFAETAEAIAAITRVLRPEASWLAALGLARAPTVVHAATKADYVPASQRGQLAALLQHLVGRDATVTTVAAIRCTEDTVITDRGRPQEAVEGLVVGDDGKAGGREAFWFAGGVPVERPSASWFDHRYAVPTFAPPAFDPARGLRHANLDGVLALALPDVFA